MNKTDYGVSVLGNRYAIFLKREQEDPKLEGLDGYCDDSVRKIVLRRRDGEASDKEDQIECEKRILRHEIIHAFLSESGLASNSGWAWNEEAIDWFALQFPKLLAAFRECGAIE